MGPTIEGPPHRWRPLALATAILVAVVLGCGGGRSADDWLRQLRDPDVVLRRQACRELAELPTEAIRIVPALAEALRDESWYVRRDAAIALAKLGPAAAGAVPALVAALADKEKSVRMAVAAALKKIDAGAAARAGVR
jgi:HEAT repeat protein